MMTTTNKSDTTITVEEIDMKHLARQAIRAHDTAHKQWLNCTDGCPPEEIDRINRQQCIDLMIKGFHSSDSKKRENWKKHLADIGLYHFEMIDSDGNGIISKEEWKLHKASIIFDLESGQGGFDSIDLNGDGVIDKDEYLACHEGFFLSIDEERFHHFFGKIDLNK